MNGCALHKVYVGVFTCLKLKRPRRTRLQHGCQFPRQRDFRFVARRPGVKTFVSDNGSNLSAADKDIRAQLGEWNASSTCELQRRGISWTFIPPRAPHRGGIWERVMAMFKRHLAALSTVNPLHVDALGTLIVEIEAIINKRPITAISTDPSDFEALTPAHILYPSMMTHSSATIVPTNTLDEVGEHRASWKRVQARVNAFWHQWRREYVTSLHERKKWTTTRKDLKNGDLIIMTDEQVYRVEWRLAPVIDAMSDGVHCRKAIVKTADGKVFKRDRTKLVLLELDGDL